MWFLVHIRWSTGGGILRGQEKCSMQKKQLFQTHGGERKYVSLEKLTKVQYGYNRKRKGGMIKSEDSRNWNYPRNTQWGK